MNPSPDILSLPQAFEEPAILIDDRFRIVSANQAYQQRYGPTEALRNRRCYEVSHGNNVPCNEAGEDCPLVMARDSGSTQRALHIHHSPAGDEHVDVETRPLSLRDGKPQFYLEIVRQSGLASMEPSTQGMVGRAPAFMEMLDLVHRVAGSDVTALLLGESGSGKEMVAQAIHEESPRSEGNFIPVECSGLTESLFESELFGHEKGAFTGALSDKPGLVEAARAGTLFLDEVGDIPLRLQVKLLRLLETGTYRRVGSTAPQQADFRLICATHRNLQEMVKNGDFRQDLYYRISAFPIRLPALRERSSDIPLLADTLLQRIPTGKNLTLSPEATERLQHYGFPGNVRELRNILERASLMASGDSILPQDLQDLGNGDRAAHENTAEDQAEAEFLTLEELENRYLRKVVAAHSGNRRSLAEKLGISERTLFRKLQRLN